MKITSLECFVAARDLCASIVTYATITPLLLRLVSCINIICCLLWHMSVVPMILCLRNDRTM